MDDRNDPENPDAHHVSGTISQNIVVKQSHKRSSVANCSPTVSPTTGADHILFM